MPRYLTLFIIAVLGCGGDDAPDGECTTRADCESGESCIDERCIGASDAGRDSAADVADDVSTDTGTADVDMGAPSGFGCSADLRNVLNSRGEPLRECGPDEGCSEGECIAACDAATASRGTLACDFRFPTPTLWDSILPPCFAVFVANDWPRPIRATVERGDESYDITTFGRIPTPGAEPADWPAVPGEGIPAGGVAVLFLSSDPESRGTGGGLGESLACPIAPAVNASTELRATGIGQAWSLRTDAPIAAYDILPYGGARSFVPSAELLLPTTAWDDEYVVLVPPRGTSTAVDGPLWLRIVAQEDGTTVRVQPSVDLPAGGGLPAIAAGEMGMITLDAGDAAFWPTGVQDPSGTLVQASAPVGVFTGNAFLRLQPDPERPGGESEHQPNLPLSALGNEYVIAPFATRRADLMNEEIDYRFVGTTDGTELSYEPAIEGAPATLDRGEVADFRARGAFIVSSQDDGHPFAIAQSMPSALRFVDEGAAIREGRTIDFLENLLGDEETTILFPPTQFLTSYVFFTDPTYGTTTLTLIRTVGDEFFTPVEIECLGVVDGWLPIGDGERFEYAEVDLRRAGADAGTCTPGRQSASSSRPFGIVVWGTDAYASYAYPAGGNTLQLNELPPLL